MNSDDSEKYAMWGIAIVVTLATLGSLYYKGLQGDNMLDAISNIGTAVIPILAAYVIVKNNSIQAQCLKEGKDALRRLQERHPDYLSGPKPDKEEAGQKKEKKAYLYLFFQATYKKQKAQLIPLAPFEKVVLPRFDGHRQRSVEMGWEEASCLCQENLTRNSRGMPWTYGPTRGSP